MTSHELIMTSARGRVTSFMQNCIFYHKHEHLLASFKKQTNRNQSNNIKGKGFCTSFYFDCQEYSNTILKFICGGAAKDDATKMKFYSNGLLCNLFN